MCTSISIAVTASQTKHQYHRKEQCRLSTISHPLTTPTLRCDSIVSATFKKDCSVRLSRQSRHAASKVGQFPCSPGRAAQPPLAHNPFTSIALVFASAAVLSYPQWSAAWRNLRFSGPGRPGFLNSGFGILNHQEITLTNQSELRLNRSYI